ncbi:MAG: YtxH domain-containing protein [Bacillota bacterium]|jgi:gas vesicle protein|uniref:Gas vesicle protein n=2 Tax=Fictibacillus TaxID=1329200 RepID=A0ABV2LFV4_9BACL|nr:MULTISPECIES: YtxH domain-containing protein [Fictibacillus]MBD7962653.1 YtxH domain-containing protein [Fictibacillus norfolkensis]MBH0157868.1 YtxH domain-containing protein [Fictibacillus sp. 5RED26]MBH0159738.1 YtxH domain-containing protein [Fictibacillus sp. 26RED30]MBH0163470.1 YtxH domain-containing protein [Fictibacillus sp. 7GRE50]MBH0170903.1 YtxH domain-containing protein [Fictibacillus sp. 18YEL24]
MSNNNNQNIDSKDFIIGALVGGMLGAAAALLLAPKAGKELRSDLNEQAVYLKDKSNEISHLAREKSSNIVKTVSEQSNQVATKVKDLTSNLRKDIDKWRAKEEENASELYGEITDDIQDEGKLDYDPANEQELVEQKY